MSMAISEHSYNDLKEYWDFQRKLEYNREILRKQCEDFEGRLYHTDTGHMTQDQLFDMLWNKINHEDLDEPDKNWVPKNEEYRLWNESTTKGKQVVLRAKNANNNI